MCLRDVCEICIGREEGERVHEWEIVRDSLCLGEKGREKLQIVFAKERERERERMKGRLYMYVYIQLCVCVFVTKRQKKK